MKRKLETSEYPCQCHVCESLGKYGNRLTLSYSAYQDLVGLHVWEEGVVYQVYMDRSMLERLVRELQTLLRDVQELEQMREGER